MADELTAKLWTALGGDSAALAKIEFSGAPAGLASRFEVAALAQASIGAATLAAAELWAKRRREPLRKVTIDRRIASAAFRCERLLSAQGWKLPDIWDPIADDYQAADTWIRLHTNYQQHREAALRVLKTTPDKKEVAAAVKGWKGEELERAIVEAGGCAAALRSMDAWRAHAQGAALAQEPLIAWHGKLAGAKLDSSPEAPLAGIRVLDLTRVIAGPVGTRYLAAFGAQVLRIDPPGFAEMQRLLPDITRGKRCAALDLRTAQGKSAFTDLAQNAHVLVHGYRPGAMEALGFDFSDQARFPNLAVVRYDAYGWSGPWAKRRGFDSLVQMSSGIAHPGNDGKPTPLPAQALDHGTGYLVAAAVCRALSDGRALARLSLARTATLLADLGRNGDTRMPELGDPADVLESSQTAWGPVQQVRCPGRIDGFEVKWRESAGPLGRHPPAWL